MWISALSYGGYIGIDQLNRQNIAVWPYIAFAVTFCSGLVSSSRSHAGAYGRNVLMATDLRGKCRGPPALSRNKLQIIDLIKWAFGIGLKIIGFVAIYTSSMGDIT